MAMAMVIQSANAEVLVNRLFHTHTSEEEEEEEEGDVVDVDVAIIEVMAGFSKHSLSV